MVSPPPPAGITFSSENRPRNDLRLENENLIQPYFDRVHVGVWVYIPRSFDGSAEFAALVGKGAVGYRFWDAVVLHTLVLDQLHMNGQNLENLSILPGIKEATTSSLNEGVSVLEGWTERPLAGQMAGSCLQKLWVWKCALAHGKKVKLFLGIGPYCHHVSDWSKTPAYHGTYFYCAFNNAHYIHDGSDLARLTDFDDDDINARLVIIEEDTEGNDTDANTNQDTLA